MDVASTSSCNGFSSFSPRLIRKIELGKEFRSLRNVVLKRKVEDFSILRRLKIGFKRKTSVASMAIDNKENAFLICGGSNGDVVLTNLISSDFGSVDEVVAPTKLNHRYMVTSCQFLWRDIRLFVTASMDGTVKLWDLGNLSHLDTFRFRDHLPLTLHWNEHNKKNPLIAVADFTSNVPLIDIRAGIAQELFTRTEKVQSVRWFPSDKHLLAVGSTTGKVTIYDVRSARRSLFAVQAHPTSPIDGIRFSSCGRSLITCSLDMEMKVFDADTMKFRNRFNPASDLPPYRMSSIRGFTVCGSANNLMAAIPFHEDVLWTTVPQHQSEVPSVHRLSGHFQNVNACVYREDAQQLFTSGGDQSVFIWASEGERGTFVNMESKKRMETEEAHRDAWSDED